MRGMLAAEGAILVHFKTIGCVLLVLESIVVPLLAFVASQSNLYSHYRHLLVLFGPQTSCLPACTETGRAAFSIKRTHARIFLHNKNKPLRRQVICILTQRHFKVNIFFAFLYIYIIAQPVKKGMLHKKHTLFQKIHAVVSVF